jgi:glycosyltransferase involved in cell wall biosynthesis
VPAKHFPVPVDTDFWKFRTLEERDILKESLGLKGKIIFFVNGDSNERKNIGLIIEAAGLLKDLSDLHFVILTRKDLALSWKLDDLILEMDVTNKVTVMNRGISQDEVRKLYTVSDFFLNPSKAEGESLGILEAMSVGVPVLATNATAMKKHISDGKGIPLDYCFTHRDSFGNGRRYWVCPDYLAEKIRENYTHFKENPGYYNDMIKLAREYVETRTLEKAGAVLDEILNEQT